MYRVDLNCDLGESFGNYTIGLDEEVIPHISSANVACGWHASDPMVMEQTVKLAKQYHVAIGAHPGFPDLMGFGRRPMNITPAEAKAYTKYQIGALSAFCKAQGVPLCHVKPHGAFYNMAGKDLALAKGICEGIAEIDPKLILLALSGSQMIEAAKQIGIPYAMEVFADRAYEEDGSLVDRKKTGSVITDHEEAVRRVVKMVTEGKVTAITGKEIELRVDSICVHGDNISAVEFVKEIRKALEAKDVAIQPLAKVVGIA